MAINTITICYSGTLNSFNGSKSNGTILKWLRDWFWTYSNNSVDASTRSAYYLIHAVRILKQEHNISCNQLKINLWGSIDKGNIEQIKTCQVEEFFEIGGYYPKSESMQKLQSADLLFLPLEMSATDQHKSLFIPGKLFEYLSMRKPILALCEESDSKAILQNSGLGAFAKPNNPEEIAQLILSFILDKNQLNLYQPDDNYISQFAFKEITKQVADIFNKVLENK
jgi:glycosyltransferase involved in cell wall biosynthesis